MRIKTGDHQTTGLLRERNPQKIPGTLPSRDSHKKYQTHYPLEIPGLIAEFHIKAIFVDIDET